jgi:hypothetical protein
MLKAWLNSMSLTDKECLVVRAEFNVQAGTVTVQALYPARIIEAPPRMVAP